MNTAEPSSNGTGRTSPKPKASKTSKAPTSPKPTSGSAGSPAKTSPWLEWGQGLGLKGSNLASFTSFLDWLNAAAPDLFSSRTCQVFSLPTGDKTSKSLFELWPNSGIVWDGVCLTAKTSESPSPASECSLLELIETGAVPQKYFLSPNAARGILRRAARMERELFPPLKKALEILSQGH